jgi:hypothetical protein
MHRYNSGEDAVRGQNLSQVVFVDSEIPRADGETFEEPDIITPERNLDNRVIKSKSGDNFVVVGDGSESDGTGYMLISHSSGSVIQIDQNGTILVKSDGDTFNSVEGDQMTYVKGDSHTNIQDDYTLRINRGDAKIYINGDLDIVANTVDISARGTMNLNAGTKMNISGGGVGIQAIADDINLAATNNTKIKTGSILNGGGFYVNALFGDFNIDSYKTNMYSIAYTKIHSTGTPAISTQLLPYPDAGMNGVDISSTTGLKLQSNTAMNLTCLTNLGISSVGTLGLSAGGLMNLYAVGALGIGATAAVSIDSINPAASVLLGSGTAAATAGAVAGNLTASLATFVAPGHIASTNIPNLSATEQAAVVKPPEIEGVRPALYTDAKGDDENEEKGSAITSAMASGDNLNDEPSNVVRPRPSGTQGRRWDRQYSETHNNDGTPK